MSEESRRKGRNPQNLKTGRKQQDAPQEATSRRHSSRTSGENRDFDDSGASRNQGHGHPREERSDRSG
jgi:hypothetical protein